MKTVGTTILIGIIGLFLMSIVHHLFIISIRYVVKTNENIASFHRTTIQSLQKYKYIVGIFLLGSSIFGMQQATKFYLYNGAFYWFLVISAFAYMLLFIIPLGSVLLPFSTLDNRLLYYFFLIVGGVTLFWIIALLSYTDPYIHLLPDGKEEASLLVKNTSVTLLIINYLLQVIYLSKYVRNKRTIKKE